MTVNHWPTKLHISPILSSKRSVHVQCPDDVMDLVGAFFQQVPSTNEITIEVHKLENGHYEVKRLGELLLEFEKPARTSQERDQITGRIDANGYALVTINRAGYFMFATKFEFLYEDIDAGDYDELKP